MKTIGMLVLIAVVMISAINGVFYILNKVVPLGGVHLEYKPESSDNYRILYDGHDYKVQEISALGGWSDDIFGGYFKTQQAAEERISERIKMAAARRLEKARPFEVVLTRVYGTDGAVSAELSDPKTPKPTNEISVKSSE